MVNSVLPGLDATFSALADPTRRAILARLARGSATVGEVAEPFSVSLPAVSKHVRVLEQAGLVARERRGRTHRLRLRATPMREAAAWMGRYRRFWEERLDALDDYLKRNATALEAGREEEPWKPRRPDKKRRSGSAAASRRPEKPCSGPGPSRKP